MPWTDHETESLAELFCHSRVSKNKSPLEAVRKLKVNTYPIGVENHHKPRSLYVQYSEEGAGIWTTYLGLAKALILADEMERDG